MTWCADWRAVDAWARSVGDHLVHELELHTELVRVRAELDRCRAMLRAATPEPRPASTVELGRPVPYGAVRGGTPPAPGRLDCARRRGRDMSASGYWAGSERTVPSHPHRSSRRINYVDLTLAECQTLLESRDIGRIGWNAGHGPQILPVSYACVAELIVFRTSPFGVLSELVRPTQVVFEVDDLDATQHTGWSVIARGRGQAVASPALLTHLWTVDGGRAVGRWRAQRLHRDHRRAVDRPFLRITARAVRGATRSTLTLSRPDDNRPTSGPERA